VLWYGWYGVQCPRGAVNPRRWGKLGPKTHSCIPTFMNREAPLIELPKTHAARYSSGVHLHLFVVLKSLAYNFWDNNKNKPLILLKNIKKVVQKNIYKT